MGVPIGGEAVERPPEATTPPAPDRATEHAAQDDGLPRNMPLSSSLPAFLRRPATADSRVDRLLRWALSSLPFRCLTRFGVIGGRDRALVLAGQAFIAFIPLLILWLGVGEAQKLAVIFLGSFFQIVLMVAFTVGQTRRDLVEAAYTLGATDAGIVKRVLIPHAAPEIAEHLRLTLGWAWTYVIVAELIGSSSGIGHMITDSQALLATDQMIFGIIVIGLIGLISDFVFRAANARLFHWKFA